MLSKYRDKKSAKRFFKKLLNNQHNVDPKVINVDKSPTFPPALSELQASGEAPAHTKLRAIKYLNNSMENKHKFTNDTARNALDGMETIRMIQKGQVRFVGKDIVKQHRFIKNLFVIAA